ncbi:hypothetical protein LVK54_07315, partial [Escherichia coli]|nr:hypothetical protein [Escherichia coli]
AASVASGNCTAPLADAARESPYPPYMCVPGRSDKTRQASHPASAPRHWRMRRERLIRPTCAIPQAG